MPNRIKRPYLTGSDSPPSCSNTLHCNRTLLTAPFQQSDSRSSSKFMAPRGFQSSASISGIIAGSVGFVVFLCLGIYLFCSYRSKANKKRIARRCAGSFRVRGVVTPMMAETNPLSRR
ncbi:hypothetical protein J3R82DRAFT_11866 [Butyriboletus roseoflavus]|nr:hypothetical protein J3R82DRAFT_11866 [Butyriboletus roseoflavus]